MDNKGSIDPMVIAGLFVTGLLLWAIGPVVMKFVNGIAETFGGTAGSIVMMVPTFLVLAVVATFWDYQRR